MPSSQVCRLGCKLLSVPRVYKLVANAENCLQTICKPAVYKLVYNLATSFFGPVPALVCAGFCKHIHVCCLGLEIVA